MNSKETAIDRVEEAMRQEYRAASGTASPSAAWRVNVMQAVYREQLPERLQLDRAATRLLHLSWAAAGIAACFLLVTALFHELPDNSLEQDFMQLYNDNSSIEQLSGEWP